MNSLVDLFEESVRKHGEHIAITNKSRQYSYKETNQIANRMARYFIEKGIKKGDNVGVFMKKSENILFLIIGLLKNGVTYVPIDPESPATRVKHIIKKSDLKLLIGDKDIMSNHPCEYLTINEVLEKSKELETNNLNTQISPKAPAYIIFTSGSTGNPKGVCVSHENVMSLFTGCHDLFEINNKDKWTFFHSYAFDFSVWEMWGAWVYGGEVIVVSFEDSRNPIAFVDLMVRTQTTIFNCTPSAFFEMIDEIIKRQHELNLKYIIFGGEALNFGKLKAWFSKENTNLPKLINMYGITETTVHVTHKVIKKSDVEKGITNIGKVLPHLGYKVINQDGKVVVKDGEGELYVSGKGVSLGYYKNPEMNKDKFTSIDGIRYYKSGDIVKLLNNGELQYISRNDEQVQLRGYRIELGEIETFYNSLDHIKNAVVTTDKLYNDDMHLILYYVANQELSTNYLRQCGRHSLPSYMVPSFFVEVDKIPLTVNGKLDKSQLPMPNIRSNTKTVARENDIGADNKIDGKLWGVISEILGHSEIDANESFLEVGFNSLLMMRLMVKVKELFNIELIPSEMLENDSISKLSKLIKIRMNAKMKHHTIPKSNTRTSPLSYEQENLWFLYKTDDDKSLYNIIFSYDMSGDVDEKKLELSLNELSRKQSILKSVIQEQAGKGLLIFDDSIHHVISHFDITDISLEQKEEEINNLIKMESEREFDLENGPLLSVMLIKKNNNLYQLVCNIHHIIFDGWSIPILIENWFNIYEQMVGEKQLSIEDPPIQYRDYSYWQKNSPTYISKESTEFWDNEVSTIKQKSLLQYDYPKLDDNQKKCDTIRFSLPAEIQSNLEGLNRKTKSTLFMTLLTVYQTFLSVYLDEEEVVVGSPLAKRNNVDTEKLIGYFVNTLPFKINVSSADSFEEILTENIKKISMIFNHQDLPSEEILKFSSLDRTINSAPLFDTVFVLQNNIKPNLTYQTLELERKRIDTLKAKFDLVVHVDEMYDGELVISFEYNKELFKKTTIQRMVNNFQHWLREITLHQDRNLKDLSYIEPKQLQKLMEMNVNRSDQEEFNQSTFEDVISRFEKIVKMNPDDIAVVHGDHQITYKELNERANKIAYQLYLKNIGPEDKIGVFIERSINMVTAILSIMKVGAVYVPLEPSLPKTRLEYMIEDSQIVYCLTTKEEMNTYPDNLTKVILIDEVIKQSRNKDFPSKMLSKNNLAYIIYTSGTTGKPKGVMIEHDGLANLCDWHTKYYSVNKKDTALMVSSSSFDASIWEIFPYLTNGNKLVVIDYWDLLDVDTLSKKMAEENVSLGFFSTGLLEQLFINDMKFPESVRAILTGGDRLKTIPNNPSFELYNNYGPTEGTVVSTAYKVERNNDKNIPIGKPISNVETYVFNSKMHLAPLGQIGELYIGGKGIARGYINDTEKNLESFVPNPFNPLERLYKTGDLVKYTEEGNLIFLGRKDDQVKIRGYRVELEEINSVLKRHTGIKDSIVTIKEESQSRKSIIAYYISDEELDESSFQDYMRKYLPHYMIPSYFIRMSVFPLTVNGKVDMKNLPKLGSPVNETESKKVINNTEKKLLNIWKNVLNNPEISIFDNFFECGGDSILSIQISSLAKEENLFITSKDIFEKQTIAELAKTVEHKEIPELSQSEVFGTTPLTPIQHWFFNQNFTDIHHWNQSVTLVGYPLLDKNKLDDMMFHIVKHHDGLRTSYSQEKTSTFVEKNMNQNKFWSTTYVDYSELNEEEKQQKIKEIEKSAQRSINIFNGPIMNLVCIRSEKNEHRIIWIIHHLVVDGVSWRILIEDFDQLYFQIVENQVLKLKKKTTSFREWANKLNNYGEYIPGNIKNYWSKECNKVYESVLVKSEGQYDEKVFNMKLTKQLTDLIYNDLSKALDASIDEIYLSVFTRLIGQYFNEKTIPIHLEGHGREEIFEDIDLSRTVGWFTTLFPMILEDKDSLSKVIESTKRKSRDLPNKGIDYGILTELHGIEYNKHHKPIVSFNNLGKFDLTNHTGAKEIHLFSENDIKYNEYKEHEIDIELLLVEGVQEIKIKFNRNFVREDFESYINAELIHLIHKLQEETIAIESTNIYNKIPDVQMDKEELNQLLLRDPKIVDVYDLTILQKGMLYHSLFDNESSHYKVQLIFEIEGSLNYLRMEEAIKATVEKHDILNTKFYSDKKGQFYQLKMSHPNVNIEYKDSMDDSHIMLEKIIDEQYKSIDIENNRLNTFLIIKLADNNHLLVWSFHHIIMDGWSYSMVINDIFNCYHSKEPFAIKTTPFKQYVEYMKEYVEQENLRNFWLNKLNKYSNRDSRLIESTDNNEFIESVYFKEIDEQMNNSIQQFCKEFRVTNNSFFLTIWLATIREFKGTDNVCCGVVTSGRNVPVNNIEKIVGPIINTIPFIKEINEHKPYGELVKEVQDEYLELNTYENTPLSKIYEWAETDHHLFESLYSFENYPMTLPSTKEFKVRLKEGKEITHYPIAIIINPNKGVQIKFNEAVISESMRLSIITTFNLILDEILAKKKIG